MPTSSRPRKKYRPQARRRLLSDPMGYVKYRQTLLSSLPDTCTRLQLHLYSSLSAFRTGTATFHDFDTLVNALNLADALANGGLIGSEAGPAIRSGQDALAAVATRLPKLTLRGPELTTITAAVEFHAAQLEIVTVSELEAALDCVEYFLKTGKSRKLTGPDSATISPSST